MHPVVELYSIAIKEDIGSVKIDTLYEYSSDSSCDLKF